MFYPTIDYVESITSPILYVRGMKDEIVPSDHTGRLKEASKKSKFVQIYECAEGNHNMTW